MMSHPFMSRRAFLAAAATLGHLWGCAANGGAGTASRGIKLGVASYSLRKFSRSQAIEMIRELGVAYVNVKSFHLTYESSPEELRSGRLEFEDAGLQIVGGGTITLQNDDDEDIGRYFEYAKNCGMPLMVIAPSAETLPRIERFVRQYDIKVAIHNHGPEDKHFPRPQDALELIMDMDPRVGLCVDVGHTARAGADVVQSIRQAGSRVLDMHMKDLKSFSDAGSQCVVGQGQMPVTEIFEQLHQMKYPGYVNLEYEIHPDDPLPGMKASFAYMHSVLDRISA